MGFSSQDKWSVIPFSKGSSWHRDQTRASSIAGRFLTVWATREASRRIPRAYDNSKLNILINCQIVFQSGYTILHPAGNVWVFQFLCILTDTCYCPFFFFLSLLVKYEVVSQGDFDLHFPNDWLCVTYLRVLISYLHLFFGKISTFIFHMLLNQIVFLLLSCKSSLCTLDKISFIRYMICKHFLLFSGLSFSFSC